MFNTRFWPARYFAARYWPKVGADPSPGIPGTNTATDSLIQTATATDGLRSEVATGHSARGRVVKL